MIRVKSLDCWHANKLIYQADGVTDDGRDVFVHYRRPWFSVWVGIGPYESGAEDDLIRTDAHPDHDPSTIDRATLAAWTEGVVEWPERIDGYANESAEG